MKILFWCATLLGLLPCGWLALQGIAYWQLQRIIQRTNFLTGPNIIRHDDYMTVAFGPLTMSIHPRLWAFGVLAAGIVAIVISLIFLLHVRVPDRPA